MKALQNPRRFKFFKLIQALAQTPEHQPTQLAAEMSPDKSPTKKTSEERDVDDKPEHHSLAHEDELKELSKSTQEEKESDEKMEEEKSEEPEVYFYQKIKTRFKKM